MKKKQQKREERKHDMMQKGRRKSFSRCHEGQTFECTTCILPHIGETLLVKENRRNSFFYKLTHFKRVYAKDKPPHKDVSSRH